MTELEAISYIENYGWSTTKLGLERTKSLLAFLGHPEKSLKFIHVAGSNGKGSTSAMLASILKEAGYRTGLYISPYIQEFGERIQINGIPIPGERLSEITGRVKEIADEMDDHPSQFELVTAIALEYYREENCDIVVLEVGMGGLLDSTNAIDAAEISVLCNIGLEHTEYLGDTIEEIAETKGGIIKEGTRVVCYDSGPEVTNVIRKICDEKKVPLCITDFDRIVRISSDLDSQKFKRMDNTGEFQEYSTRLLGAHQLNNCEVVFETINLLKENGWVIPESAIKDGLANVVWPARFEVLSKDPVFILDGGHNPQCAEALKESIKEYLPDRKVIFILGVLRDKDYDSILDLILTLGYKFITVTPKSDRALTGEEFASVINKRGGDAINGISIENAIRLSLDLSVDNNSYDSIPIIAFGSLYLAGAIRKEFMPIYKAWLRRRVKDIRNSIDDSKKAEYSKIISENISKTEAFIKSKTIMLYKWAFGEVRLDDLENMAIEDGKRIAYPSWEGDEIIPVVPNNRMSFKEIDGFTHPILEESKELSPEEIDVVVCPLVAYDLSGFRLGMGGGYYDRFLPQCKNATIIGAAYSAQKINEVPTEPHDIKLDLIITEKG